MAPSLRGSRAVPPKSHLIAPATRTAALAPRLDLMRSHITCRIADGVARVQLDRPDKLNALTLDMLDDLVATARRLRADRSLRAVILSGAGDSFCAGLDFATVLKNPRAIAAAFVARPWLGTNTFQEACWAWRRLPVPVVAVVHGHCFGGGCRSPSARTSGSRPRTPSGPSSSRSGGSSRTCPGSRASPSRRSRRRKTAHHDRGGGQR